MRKISGSRTTSSYSLTKAQVMKEKIDKLDFNKMKNFCSAKDLVKYLKTKTKKNTHRLGEKTCSHIPNKQDQYLEYIKNS